MALRGYESHDYEEFKRAILDVPWFEERVLVYFSSQIIDDARASDITTEEQHMHHWRCFHPAAFYLLWNEMLFECGTIDTSCRNCPVGFAVRSFRF